MSPPDSTHGGWSHAMATNSLQLRLRMMMGGERGAASQNATNSHVHMHPLKQVCSSWLGLAPPCRFDNY
jgi:hypothetical protein